MIQWNGISLTDRMSDCLINIFRTSIVSDVARRLGDLDRYPASLIRYDNSADVVGAGSSGCATITLGDAVDAHSDARTGSTRITLELQFI